MGYNRLALLGHICYCSDDSISAAAVLSTKPPATLFMIAEQLIAWKAKIHRQLPSDTFSIHEIQNPIFILMQLLRFYAMLTTISLVSVSLKVRMKCGIVNKKENKDDEIAFPIRYDQSADASWLGRQGQTKIKPIKRVFRPPSFNIQSRSPA